MSDVFIHPTAIVEKGVEIGPGTKVWDNVHIRRGVRIGSDCIIGEKTYIAYDVEIGNCVKINAQVYICALVTIEDFVMVSAGTVFTNDRYPRAFSIDPSGLATSAPTEETLPTRVLRGTTIGANATIGCGLEVGRFAMVGMGSVVTKTVPDFTLVYGNPAKPQGYVCICGLLLGKSRSPDPAVLWSCSRCRRRYSLSGERIHLLE